MNIISIALFLVGGLICLIALPALIVPVIGVPMMLIGAGCIYVGILARQKGREHAVRRQMGDRGLF